MQGDERVGVSVASSSFLLLFLLLLLPGLLLSCRRERPLLCLLSASVLVQEERAEGQNAKYTVPRCPLFASVDQSELECQASLEPQCTSGSLLLRFSGKLDKPRSLGIPKQ